ncbi:uncharacterized protein stops [Periplaneta americana]|uniref:uncharacterized protein stops n=1 Tax=Periplaneta americana TaxID=6978 RepID=UPI0037E8E5D2
MEVLLDCYFDNVFCQLDRTSLMVPYRRRQLVDYLNTMIQGCVQGEDCDHDTGVRRAVLAAIRHHATTVSTNGTVCLMGKFHNILYIATKLCYDWKLEDTQIVSRLLNDIYRCEKTFERLMIGAIFGTRVTHFISGWKSDFESPEESLAALEYFLQHATKARLEYTNEVDGKKVRFADVPMESYGRTQAVRAAAQFSKDEVLLLLLRYGADLMADYENREVAVEQSLQQLNAFCTANLPLTQTPGPLACIKILLRTVPTMTTLASTSFNCVSIDTEKVFGTNKLYFHPLLFTTGVIPTSRSGITPPELKHLCRCAIRDILRKNWQLPLGIRSLEIPTSLQDYLDLLED